MKCPYADCEFESSIRYEFIKHLRREHKTSTIGAMRMADKAEAASTKVIPATEGKEEVSG